MPSPRHTALTLPCTCARSMTRRRIPCTLSSRVIGSSSHSGFLGRTSTLGKIGQMALLFVHGKCQHYYESGHPRVIRSALLTGTFWVHSSVLLGTTVLARSIP